MPGAHAILWFLGVFVGLWAASLIARGWLGDRARGRRRCPACRAMVPQGLVCASCRYEAKSERALRATRRDWRLLIAGLVLLPSGGAVCYTGVKVWAWSHLSHDLDLSIGLWDSSAGAVAVFGLVLIAWALRGEPSRGRRRCPSCWYDMGGSALRCPECGHQAAHASHLYRPRRRWKAAALASFLLLAAVAIQGTPRVSRGGWRAVFPSSALIAFLPWLPDSLAATPDPAAEEDWTLQGRMSSELLWGWQQRWLMRRARSLVAEGTTASQIHRGLAFVPPATRQSLTRAVLLCLGDLAAGKHPQQAIDSLEELQSYGGRNGIRLQSLPPELDRTALRRMINDDATEPRTFWVAVWALSLTDEDLAAMVLRILRFAAGGTQARSGRLLSLANTWVLRGPASRNPAVKAACLAALSDPDQAVVECACWVLGHPSLGDAEVARRLFALLESGDDARAAAASLALSRIEWRPSETIPAILKQARAERAARGPIVAPLSGFSEQVLPHLSSLLDLLADPDPQVRLAIINAIGACERSEAFHAANSAVAPALSDLTRDPDPAVAQAAQTLLGGTPGDR